MMSWILAQAKVYIDDAFHDGYVKMNGSMIEEVGKGLPHVGPDDEVWNVRGAFVLPGLVNTHNHTPMTLLRGLGEGEPLKRWLEDVMWPREAMLSEEDVYWGTLLAQAEMIESGTTTFLDMYDRLHVIFEAVRLSGMRAVLARGMIGSEDPSVEAAKLKEAEDVSRRYHGALSGRITMMISPHGAYTCSSAFLKEIIELSRALSLPVTTHLAETRQELLTVKKREAMETIPYLEALGLFERPLLVAHAVHLSERDRETLARYDVRISHNPVSNLKLGSGIAPIPDLIRRGLTISLGTDGAASNNNYDLFEEMRMAALLHKGKEEDATLIHPNEALRMATAAGARALFLEHVIGKLAKGYRADLIIVRSDGLPYVPAHDDVANLVYNGRGSDVLGTIVDGRLLYWKGEHLTLDTERIRYEARLRAKRLA
ncbi:MAG: S-adenosylhomocysteine deaminase [Candidatus Carbobacillus altaicus]|uniref:5-methylthioadenosine/S-adenosylhomocysteine deaminase n=1 Tax=Candidatus Carbonibacillus altaicus TaxID=2163959 RepID=A0A2R6Y2P1_9BACL|nr:MAG: S-adenosylhomocysteine deaminase [Candidatus Carbobacillus altaicus]